MVWTSIKRADFGPYVDEEWGLGHSLTLLTWLVQSWLICKSAVVLLSQDWAHGFLLDLGNGRINNQDLIQSADAWRWLCVRFALKLVRYSRLNILTLKPTLQMRKRTLNIGTILRFLTQLPSLLSIASTHLDLRLPRLFFVMIFLHYLLNLIAC